MLNALARLGEAPFLLVNGDIWTDFDFNRLPREPQGLAHLVMIDPPGYATHGDFALDPAGHVRGDGERRLTYAGIGVYRPALLDGWAQHVDDHASIAGNGKPRFRLAPILRAHMPAGRIHGEHHAGRWTDVGTPERLADLNRELSR